MDGYTVGKGIVTIDGVDVGNCPEFTFRHEVTRMTRYRVVNGVRCPMQGPIIERRGKLRISLDEWTDEVVAIATSGAEDVSIVVTQTQAIGAKRIWTFPHVDISPAGDVSLITNSWGVLTFDGDAIFDSSGEFMTVGAA